MQLTGTVSDFDDVGGFGLIAADEGGELLPFNARVLPASVRDDIEVGSRVRFSRMSSGAATRAIEVALMGDWSDERHSQM